MVLEGQICNSDFLIIITWCTLDLGDEHARSTPLSESRHRHAYGHCRLLLPSCVFLISSQSGVEKWLV